MPEGSASQPPVIDAATLPTWDLDDLYPGRESTELAEDLDKAKTKAEQFSQAYQGKVEGLSGAQFADAIVEYEVITELLGRIMSYAQLEHSGDVSDSEIGRFYQSMQEKATDISSHTLFFTLEINRLSEDQINDKLKEPKAAHYGPWLRDVRVFKDHELSDELEKLLHEKSVTGRNSWNRLFDQTMAGLRFPLEDQSLTVTEALNLLSDKEPSTRKKAAKSIAKVLGENKGLFALITNTLAKDKAIEDGWRRYPSPISARNMMNQVEDEVVQALVSAVQERYPSLAHRYYALKAKWLGMEKLNYWDRNAPLPDDDDKLFGWDEARDTVLSAYEAFSPDLAKVGKKFFDNAWIDAPARAGKASGAFAHPTVPSAHPYLLLNFMGKSRDVMTLAHELGHGVHQVLSAGQGNLMADTPLTLAETASVFGEMLTFRSMLDHETAPKRRRAMLAGKVEDMLNTVVRQIAFHSFEDKLHTERAEGELSPERIGEIWMECQRESLGPAFHLEDDYQHYWAYIPHFVHAPFYVYAYAFGDCLVNSLYSAYLDGTPDFQAKYMEMLSAGGTLRHKELLAPFGLDASDPGFWKQGLSVVSGFIDELEQEA